MRSGCTACVRWQILAMVVCAFITSCQKRNAGSVVALQPFDGFQSSWGDTVASVLKTTYDIQVVVLAKRKLPKSAFVNMKTPRYRADSIIQLLSIETSDSIDYVMGLTNEDISFTKRDPSGRIKSPASKYADWGIFGLAYSPGRSSVVSTHRISNHSQNVWFARLKKIAVHELGHNFGLKHCKTRDCVMRDAVESIATIDEVGVRLCATCKARL